MSFETQDAQPTLMQSMMLRDRQLRMLLFDPQRLMQPGLYETLDSFKSLIDVTIVGTTYICHDVLASCAMKRPDVILLITDWRTSTLLEAVRTIHKRFPALPLVVLNVLPTPLHILTTFVAGAKGYVTQDGLPDLPEVLWLAVRGGFACCSASARTVMARVSAIQTLSPRETLVAAQVAAGQTTAEIAQTMGLKRSTVETYIGRILRKINGRTRLDIGIWWQRYLDTKTENSELSAQHESSASPQSSINTSRIRQR